MGKNKKKTEEKGDERREKGEGIKEREKQNRKEVRGYIILTLVQGLALGARVARAGFRSKLHIWFLDIVYHYIKAYNTRCLENLPFGGRGFESHCLLLFFI